MCSSTKRREGEKREREEVADIRAEAKTAPIVRNQSAANWYNYRDRAREDTKRHTHTH